ncbi:MAG: sensor histidine kinase [Candidatus Dormibacteria bacterium]
MNASWRTVEDPQVMPTADFASEILVRGATPVGVLDHRGKLAFANPAFLTAGLATTLLDPRGFLVHPRLEQLRLGTIRGELGVGSSLLEVPATEGAVRVELLGLGQVPGWTALVVHALVQPAEREPDLPSPDLLLHELRSPLLAIRVALDGLTQECADRAPELLGAVGRQSRAVARLAGVLTGLGDLIRARELAAHRAETPLVDLTEVVRDVFETYSTMAELSGHRLEVELQPGTTAVRGDQELLGRAVANLVDNALKYSLPPGPIRLGLFQRGALVVVEVADGGPAIPAGDRLRVFAPFVRLERADATDVHGSGLGLAVVQRVARAHGGSLSLESAAEAGNTFRLSFLALGGHARRPPAAPWVADAHSR